MDAIQVLTEPHRRELLRLVWDHERSAGELAGLFDLTFGAVSQHLARLRDAGFVSVRAEGNHRFYSADQDRLAPYAPMLEAMWSTKLDQLVADIETDNTETDNAADGDHQDA